MTDPDPLAPFFFPNRVPGSLKISEIRHALVLLLGLLSGLLLVDAEAQEANNQEINPKQLVADAWRTLGNFIDDPEQAQFRELLPKARAILIVPKLLRAGFLLGGAGGSGVLLGREPKGSNWSQPAFYQVGGPSIGLQAGAQLSELVFLIMSQKGLDAILASKVKFGSNLSLAAGSGKGSGTNANADVLSFGRGKGLFAGVAGEGILVEKDNESVRRYYGKDAPPQEILGMKTVYNRDASKLIMLLSKAAKPRPTAGK